MRRYKLFVSLLLFVSIPGNAQPTPAGCTGTDIVIADHRGYAGAIARAGKKLGTFGISSFPQIFEKNGDVDQFARQIRQLRPRILVIHFSIFESITDAQAPNLREFITSIEHGSEAVHPQYVVYSASFRHVPTPAGQWITRPRHPFDAIPANRIATINLTSLRRFENGNGEDELRRIVSGLVARGACAAAP